jgi:hypothetical protein
MEPITFIVISYSITMTVTIVYSYYISSYIGDAVYNKMVK